MIPFITVSVLLFALFIRIKLRKKPQREDEFWAKEQAANSVRPKDISGLDYMTISLDSLPMSDREDVTLNSYRDAIRSLANKKFLNLSGQTNTDLKLQYGSANLTRLSEYDSNYTELVSMLHKWGVRLYSLDLIPEAQAVLEYSVSCFSDVAGTYRLLARLYHGQNSGDKINALIRAIPGTKVPDQEKLIDELTSLLSG